MGEERTVKRVAKEALSLKGNVKCREFGAMSCGLWMG